MDAAAIEWQTVVELLNAGKLAEVQPLLQGFLQERPDDETVNFAAGLFSAKAGHILAACDFFRKAITLNPGNIDAHLHLATTLTRAPSHRNEAECRDVYLNLLDNHQDLIKEPSLSDHILREAARYSAYTGQRNVALRLRRELAARTGAADDYFDLSESCAETDHLDEAEAALRKAIELEPGKYAKPIHQQSLHLLESTRAERSSRPPIKKSRYPDTDIFAGDLPALIRDHIAAGHKASPKFITRDTKFFAMGSCFARNLAGALVRSGYDATNMEISEAINTTFANKHFVDWLEDTLPDNSVRERIEELWPTQHGKDYILERIRQADVFIMTLGVAPVFFDRLTGEFVMPRPTHLNQRALAEKYLFRSTTVEENVRNATYLLSFMRKISPDMKIVVTVSPVPLHMTFEFNSAVEADCLSKSTMRLVAHELVYNSGFKDIYYWPSFEVFRWAPSHRAESFFGNDDGSAWHVSEAVVDIVIRSFIELFGSSDH